jgi:hypothetical protein
MWRLLLSLTTRLAASYGTRLRASLPGDLSCPVLSCPGNCCCGVQVLKRGRRFMALEQFHGTGFDSSVKQAEPVLKLLRELPIDALTSSSSLQQLSVNMTAFIHVYQVRIACHFLAASAAFSCVR